MKFIRFGTLTTLSKTPAAYRSLLVGSSVVQSCETVRDLGAWFDSELSMKTHHKVVSSGINYDCCIVRGSSFDGHFHPVVCLFHVMSMYITIAYLF